VTVTVGYQQSTTYPAAVDRAVVMSDNSMDGGLGLDVSMRPGVMVAPVGSMFEASAGAPLAITIAPGVANVTPNYRLISDAPTTLTIQPLGASPRTDLIVARVYDTEAGDAQSKGVLEVVTGTSASVPAIPARAMGICSVAWPANATAGTQGVISDKRSYTAAAGGAITWGGAANATNLLRINDGQIFYEPTSDQLYYMKSNKSTYPISYEPIGQFFQSGESGQTQGPGTNLDPVVLNATAPAGRWATLFASVHVSPTTAGGTIAGYVSAFVSGINLTSAGFRYHNRAQGGMVVPTFGMKSSPVANPELRVRVNTDGGSANCTSYAWALQYIVYGR